MTNLIHRFRIRLINRRFDRCDAARVQMYAALRAGQRRTALRAARRAARLAFDEPDRKRFERWVGQIKSGRRIKFASYPVRYRFPGDPSFETMAEIDAIEQEMT